MSGAGFEPDHAITVAPATVPIGNNRPWLNYKIVSKQVKFNHD